MTVAVVRYFSSRRPLKIRSTQDLKNHSAFQLCFLGGQNVPMGTLAHVDPRKTLSEKKIPVLDSFFVDPLLSVPNFFLLNTKYKI